MYSVDNVASMLSLSRSTVLGLVYSGALPAVKIGAQWRISAVTLSDFLGVRENKKASGAASQERLNGENG
jgi:excisionase family DNA binding protein